MWQKFRNRPRWWIATPSSHPCCLEVHPSKHAAENKKQLMLYKWNIKNVKDQSSLLKSAESLNTWSEKKHQMGSSSKKSIMAAFQQQVCSGPMWASCSRLCTTSHGADHQLIFCLSVLHKTNYVVSFFICFGFNPVMLSGANLGQRYFRPF